MLLDLSLNTVAVHGVNLRSTLKVHKAAELVLYAVKQRSGGAGGSPQLVICHFVIRRSSL
jgi:hypothetical protein